MAVRRFPVGRYGRQRMEFFPAPRRAPLRAFAALVFPWVEEQVLLCDIENRGWCIPSGRVEPGESSEEAARREALEESGAVLGDLTYMGCYRITDRDEVRWADVFAARIVELRSIVNTKESHGRRLARMEDLPGIYHMWNPLMEQVFTYSYEVLRQEERLRGFQGP